MREFEPDLIPCGLTEGYIFPPGTVDPRAECRAVCLTLASGLKYSNQVGLPDEERARKVTYLLGRACANQREIGECAYLTAEDVFVLLAMLQDGAQSVEVDALAEELSPVSLALFTTLKSEMGLQGEST